MDFRIENSVLLAGGSPLITLSGDTSLVPDDLDVGVFLRFDAEQADARVVFPLGCVSYLKRFTACHRYEPFWMEPKSGGPEVDVPIETQSLIVERDDGNCVLLIPMVDGAFHCSLQEDGNGGIDIVAESGDRSIVTQSIVGLFVSIGPNVYDLIEASARSVIARLGVGRLRVEKPLPAFVERFGWCTWDALYEDLSLKNVTHGLETFKAGGVQPKYIILDVGWQSVRKTPSGEYRLVSFAANEKFDGDLAPVITASKTEYGIETFLVWHPLHGYWGGVDGDAIPGYGVRSVARAFSPGIRSYGLGPEQIWGQMVGVVSPDHIARFFADYHRSLRRQGVDGVKVDSQATVEAVAEGAGGRVGAMRSYRAALEESVGAHFAGNLINCMSCACEMLYGAANSNVTRTSGDFYPDRPESHGLHLYSNAQVSLWFGEFVHPDWDMFQSGHAMGAFHAAGRAVGGCPVYVSDQPDGHDFEVLRKLVLLDGGVLRCLRPGRPTRDCLFYDPTSEDVLLKIFNFNKHGAVIGAFHARYAGEGVDASPISGSISPSDVEGIVGERFAVFAHNAGEIRLLALNDRWPLTLAQQTAELFTIVEIENGIAPIGLANMYNSAAAITERRANSLGELEIGLRCGGRFVAYCEKAPRHVSLNGRRVRFSFDAAAHWLEVNVSAVESCVLSIW